MRNGFVMNSDLITFLFDNILDIVRRNLLLTFPEINRLITCAAHSDFDCGLRTPKEVKTITRITKSLLNT